MCENRKLHVHFMGICGSGCASIAMIANEEGYIVSGCDQSVESYYAEELKKRGIRIDEGHDPGHLKDVDIVAVSPAIFDINPDNPELKLAQEKGILMTWQEFMGRYLQDGKRVVAVSGTHGKTTTTFLTAEILIDAGLEPTVEGGSVYKKWKSGGRYGSSDIFVCEADEFNRNFYHYKPEVAVLNNVEMDHPECFRDIDDLTESFCHFLTEDPNLKMIIANGDSEGAVRVIRQSKDHARVKNAVIRFIVRKYREELNIEGLNTEQIIYRTTAKEKDGTSFEVIRGDRVHRFKMRLYGEYNVSNAVCAVQIAWYFGVADEEINRSLAQFSGVGRRFDPVGSCKGIPVFDDYAHHPTELSSVLTMCREYFPDQKLIAVFEPHQVSRLRLMFDEYAAALKIADMTIIAKTHMGREIHRKVVPITEKEWTEVSASFRYEEDPGKIRDLIVHEINNGCCDLVIVIGAANSYKISRLLCETE